MLPTESECAKEMMRGTKEMTHPCLIHLRAISLLQGQVGGDGFDRAAAEALAAKTKQMVGAMGMTVGETHPSPQEGRHIAVHTKHSQKAGPFSVARLKMDLPFHNRVAHNAFRGEVPSPTPLRRRHSQDNHCHTSAVFCPTEEMSCK